MSVWRSLFEQHGIAAEIDPLGVRLEAKFIGPLDRENDIKLWLALDPFLFEEEYPERRVNNVYFDTFDFGSMSDNLAGNVYRSKVRYRWYGASREPDVGALEVKIKRNAYGWKEIFPVENQPHTAARSWSEFRHSIAHEIAERGRAWLADRPLTAIVNTYRRNYFLSRCGRLRVTVDMDQVAWDQRLSGTFNFCRRSRLPGLMIIEVKCAKEHAALSRDVASRLPFRRTRYSKYVQGLIACGHEI